MDRQTQEPRQRASYNVRIAPPKTRLGWLGGIFYRLKQNKEIHFSRLYALGGITIAVAVFTALTQYIKSQRRIRTEHDVLVEMEHVPKSADDLVSGADVSDELSGGVKRDYVIKSPDGKRPEILISEKDNAVEALFHLPFIGTKMSVRAPLDACQFDDDGNIVVDDHGFPMYKGQTERTLSDHFDTMKSKFQSFIPIK